MLEEEMNKKMNMLLIAVVVIVPGFILGLLGKPTEMGFAIAAGGIAAAFINLDKIQRFKGAGFEAEMKKAVEEVYATTENVRQIIKIRSNTVFPACYSIDG
jgi:hypothetical protein